MLAFICGADVRLNNIIVYYLLFTISVGTFAVVFKVFRFFRLCACNGFCNDCFFAVIVTAFIVFTFKQFAFFFVNVLHVPVFVFLIEADVTHDAGEKYRRLYVRVPVAI